MAVSNRLFDIRIELNLIHKTQLLHKLPAPCLAAGIWSAIKAYKVKSVARQGAGSSKGSKNQRNES